MTRAEYMAKLSEKLYFIPETQRKAILDYYEEMMADRMEDGMDEASAVSAMENPDTIAERLKAEGNFSMEEAQGDDPENLTDEAMKFSSLAGSLLRTFEDLEKAGHVETPEPPVPPTPPTPPEPPVSPETPAQSEAPESSFDAQDAGEQISEAVQKLVDSAADFIQRHTTESQEGDYEKKVFTCPASQVRAIRLLCGEMPIRVTACEGNDLTLTYYTCDDDPYEMNLDDGVLTLERLSSVKGGSRFTFSVLGGLIKMGWNKSAPTVELSLPRDALTDLEARASNASIKVIGCQALCQVNLKTGNSRIEATDLSCMSLECVSSNGRLVLQNVRSRQNLSCKTSNARIEGQKVSAGGLQFTTSNGRIEAHELKTKGDLILTTSNSGLLAEDCTAKGELRLTTSNGRLEVWRSEGASVSLKTSNGSIRGQMPGAQADWAIDSRTSNGKNSLPKQQPGGRPLTVHTSNGSIDLHFERE